MLTALCTNHPTTSETAAPFHGIDIIITTAVLLTVPDLTRMERLLLYYGCDNQPKIAHNQHDVISGSKG